MTGSTRVLVKVVLFQLRGPGHPQNDAMPNIFPDSKSLLLGLSNEVSFVSEIYWIYGQNSPNIFLKSCCMNIHVHQCTYLLTYIELNSFFMLGNSTFSVQWLYACFSLFRRHINHMLNIIQNIAKDSFFLFFSCKSVFRYFIPNQNKSPFDKHS